MRRRLLALLLLLPLAVPAQGAEAQSASPATGADALAIAALVAANSPLVAATDKTAIAALFNGTSRIAYPAGKTIAVALDSAVCDASNVNITEHSCTLTFGTAKVSLTGRAAHEIFATIAELGVPPDGAMGRVYEGLSHLACVIDPGAIAQEGGEGASCTFDPGAP